MKNSKCYVMEITLRVKVAEKQNTIILIIQLVHIAFIDIYNHLAVIVYDGGGISIRYVDNNR